MPDMDREALLSRARTRGVNPLVYWVVRSLMQPFFHVYFRLERIGREHIPRSGPVILASNHRSFLDPFVIAVMTGRPIYFVAKKELFAFHPVVSWLLGALGAFPIDRGASDQEAMGTARAILERGDAVLMFPEGTRTRPGSLGRPKRGVGRLALETGAPVVPIAVIGTEAVRRGFRIRPHKVRIRAGSALTFPRVERPSPALAGAVTDRIWPCVELQWEWLGGLPRLRRAAVIGAGETGTAIAVALARAGLEVDLGTRTSEAASRIGAAGRNDGALPGVPLPDGVAVAPAADIELEHHDLVVLAVPPRRVPAALATYGERVPARAGVLAAGAGLAPADADQLVALVGHNVRGRAVGLLALPEDAGALVGGSTVAIASSDAPFLAQVAATLRAAGLDVSRCPDPAAAARAAVPVHPPRRSRAA